MVLYKAIENDIQFTYFLQKLVSLRVGHITYDTGESTQLLQRDHATRYISWYLLNC